MHKILKANTAQKVAAILVVLAVVGIGAYLISAHASAPYGESVATSGSITNAASRTTDASGTNYVKFDTSSSTPSNCASESPAAATDSTYPLQYSVSFTGFAGVNGTTLSKDIPDFEPYPAANLNGEGWIEPANDVMEGSYLEMLGNKYGSNPGITGSGWDLAPEVPASDEDGYASGGFDVCVALTNNDWQNVVFVLDGWPYNNDWSDGELDFFDGTPQSPTVFVHGITPENPESNCGSGAFPTSLTTQGINTPVLISVRWNNTTGYQFYINDPTLSGSPAINIPIGSTGQCTVEAPTEGKQLSFEMQDFGLNSTDPVQANVYWAAAYDYNP